MTLTEYRACMAGAEARLSREFQRLRWAVWHNAVLPRMKKMPEFRDFLGLKPERQTPEQMMAVMSQWAAAVKHLSDDKQKD